MDLALHLGTTEAALRRDMTEHELQRWASYAGRRMLPMRRLELLLAQIALVTAKAMGGAKQATLADFLFDPEPIDEMDNDDEAPDASAIAAFFGATIMTKAKG